MNNKLLCEKLKKKKIPISKLASDCKLGYATCHDILSGKNKNPTIISIHRITSYLDVSIDELMEGDSDEESGIKD